MYTNKQKQTALDFYDRLDFSRPKLRTGSDNTPEHPRNPTLEVKLEALHRCFELGEDIQCVSEDIGYSRVSIYTWRKKYLTKGTVALMNRKNPAGNNRLAKQAIR